MREILSSRLLLLSFLFTSLILLKLIPLPVKSLRTSGQNSYNSSSTEAKFHERTQEGGIDGLAGSQQEASCEPVRPSKEEVISGLDSFFAHDLPLSGRNLNSTGSNMKTNHPLAPTRHLLKTEPSTQTEQASLAEANHNQLRPCRRRPPEVGRTEASSGGAAGRASTRTAILDNISIPASAKRRVRLSLTNLTAPDDDEPDGSEPERAPEPLPAAPSQPRPLPSPQRLQSQKAAELAAESQLSREANRRLKAELCKDFTIGLEHPGGEGGTFTSPNYPNPYPTDLICTKLIEAPRGHLVKLEFRDLFDIEEAGNDCDNDKIEIRDGRYGYSKVLARFCGNKFPPEVRSTGEGMWLRFISDGSISNNGFKAVYKFANQENIKPNPPSECRFNVTTMPTSYLPGNGTIRQSSAAGGSGSSEPSGSSGAQNSNQANNNTLEAASRTIHSGVIKQSDVPEVLTNYTKLYNVSLECIWNITVMPGWKIYLTFTTYELNKPNDCDSNFIEIYEENLTEENQTVKFCGTRTEPQQSKSNVFNIRHHALPTALNSKFEIVYTAFRDKQGEHCERNEFDCDDGTCIHESLKCDGQINCKYRYDESSDPGPCTVSGDDNTFFETEHMVIILIVFLLLVSGMCASIIISCWGKIQERRRRKQEYLMRKSREASMEGQMNRIGQPGGPAGAPGQSAAGQTIPVQVEPQQHLYAPNNLAKSRLLSQPVAPKQQVLLSAPRLLSELDFAHFPGQQLEEQENTQESLYGSRAKMLPKAAFEADLQLKQSYLSQLAHQQQQLGQNQQQAVPDAQQLNNQQQQQESLEKNPQQMLKYTANNQKYLSSMYQPDRLLAMPGQQQPAPQQTQTMPLGLAKQLSLIQQQQQQQLNYEGHYQRRGMTLASMRPAGELAGLAAHQARLREASRQPLAGASTLSNSVGCCNLLADCPSSFEGETPLLSSLAAARAGSQAGQRRVLLNDQYEPQNFRLSELRSNTLAAMPRSISAHQLSERAAANLRSQRQRQEQRQQLLQQQQQLLLFNKSASDAGSAKRSGQPLPAHSLSYPHACQLGEEARLRGFSPALPPPPPPPPNLRSATACAGSLAGSNQPLSDSRRAAFKVSRYDTSQLTSDTLQDQELLAAAALQFDEQSSESDATFGLVLNQPAGQQPGRSLAARNLGAKLATSGKLLKQPAPAGQQPQAQLASQLQLQLQGHPRAQMLGHLSECNFARRQRANLMSRQELITNQPIVCDCGALERAGSSILQLRQQQLHLQQMGPADYRPDPASLDLEEPPAQMQAQQANCLQCPQMLAENFQLVTRGQLQQQHSSGLLMSPNPYNGSQLASLRQHYGRLQQQQSSELTAEEDDEEDLDDEQPDALDIDDEDEDEIATADDDDYNLDEEISSDNMASNRLQANVAAAAARQAKLAAAGNASSSGLLGYRSIIRNEELNDSSSSGFRRLASGGGKLASSHTSISCQSCTCGSQLQLDQLADSNSNSNSNANNNNCAPNQQEKNSTNNIDNNDEFSSTKSTLTTTTTTTTNQVATTIDNNNSASNKTVQNNNLPAANGASGSGSGGGGTGSASAAGSGPAGSAAFAAGANKNTNLRDNKNVILLPIYANTPTGQAGSEQAPRPGTKLNASASPASALGQQQRPPQPGSSNCDMSLYAGGSCGEPEKAPNVSPAIINSD